MSILIIWKKKPPKNEYIRRDSRPNIYYIYMPYIIELIAIEIVRLVVTSNRRL
jgi:hypothetical protein